MLKKAEINFKQSWKELKLQQKLIQVSELNQAKTAKS